MSKAHVSISSLTLLIAGILTSVPTATLGSGFALIEQSASQMGNAFAGGSAHAGDASTVYFNPAGLTYVPHQFIGAVHLVNTVAEFSGDATDLLGLPVSSGGDGGDAGGLGVVPNLYYALPLDNGYVFGLGINAPFGLETEYDDDWVGRYQAIKSSVRTININPSLAYRVNKDFSIGAGLSLQYIDAELTQAVDQGGLCVANALAGGAPDVPTAIGICAGAGLAPQSNDAFAKIKGDDWSMGMNIGMIFEATEDTRIGLAFRSKVRHDLHGDARFRNTSPVFTSSNLFVSSDIEAKVDLPQTASLSVHHILNSRWAVMADATWTGWKSFDELKIKYQDSDQPDTFTDESWNNSMRYALGVDYRRNDKRTFRAVVAFDETPIPDQALRTARIPGEDRTWTSVGFGYRLSPALGIDVGYSHLFVKEPKLRSGSATTGILDGDYDAEVDIVSAQLVWNI
jgi:long-chain fatty acid transport protein